MIQQTSIELVAWQSNGSIQSFQLKTGQAVLVGKSSNCGLQLSGHDISDIHCRIGFEGGHLWVQDWLSTSGTRVNGEPVTSKSQVGQGSVVEVGRYKIQISKASVEAEHGIEADQSAAASEEVEVPVTVDGDASGSEAVPSPASASDERYTTDPETIAVDDDIAVTISDANTIAADDTDSAGTSPECESVVSPKATQTDAIQAGDNQIVDGSQSEASPSEASQLDETELDANRSNRPAAGQGSPPGSPMGSDFDLFSDDDDDVYDRETVELLLAEIEDLRASLAQHDADQVCADDTRPQFSAESDQSETMLHRIQELAEEANRADERVLILEEMLHAAEDVNRAEVEERAHLEAWVGDIEKRVGQREQEHAAEIDALRERLDRADDQHHRLQRKMQQTATSEDTAHKRYTETMEGLQQENRQLQDQLAETKKELRKIKQKYENQSEQSEVALREERAKIAKEHAEVSRLKFEYAQKIGDLEQAAPRNSESQDCDARIQSLREHRQHLREMSEQKKQETQTTLSGRLKRLWNSIE